MKLCCWSQSPRKKDSRWSWLVCLVASTAAGLSLGMAQCFAIVMPVFMKLFKESRSKTAVAGSISLGLIFFAMPLSTIIIKRINFRLGGMLGMLLVTISLFITSFTQSLLQIFFSYSILYGLGASLVFTSNIVAITSYFDKRHSVGIGFLSAGQNAGTLALGPILQVLVDLYGFRWMYRIMAATFLIAIFLIAISFDTNVESTNQDANLDQGVNDDQRFTFSNIAKLFKTPAYVIAVTTLTLEALAAFVSFVHLISFCIEVNIEAPKASLLFIAIGVSSIVSCVISGRILDIKAVNPFYITQAGALSMGLSMSLVQFATNFNHFIVYATFLGLGLGTFLTTIVVLLMKTVQVRLSLIGLSVGEMFSSFGNAAGSPLIGFIADIQGSYKPAFTVAGGIMLFAFFLPFLQYCFKPWREEAIRFSVDAANVPSEVVLSDGDKENRAKGNQFEEVGLQDLNHLDQPESHVNLTCVDEAVNETRQIADSNDQTANSCVGNSNGEIRNELNSHTNTAVEMETTAGIVTDNECKEELETRF